MNYLILSYLTFGVFCSVCSQNVTSCDLIVTDLKYNKIDINTVCNSDKPCLVKCCGENEVIHTFHRKLSCKNIEVLKKEIGNNLTTVPLDYSNLNIYQNDIYKHRTVSSKKFNDFTLLHSNIFMSTSECVVQIKNVTILEKGDLVLLSPHHYNYWTAFETPNFCVDLMIGIKKGTGSVVPRYVYLIKIEDQKAQNLYIAIAMTISVFFLFLVLVVYCVLPQLRNMHGLLLMAYVATLMCMYAAKAAHLFSSFFSSSDCTLRSQIIYFLILASFFWLKLMSFDIWWTFRGSRKRREIHRRGVHVKFMIYASYAYGVPAAITIFAVIMDGSEELPVHVVKPLFEDCLTSDASQFYLFVPIMILTGFNCLLFLMTMYNIWLISRALNSFDKNTVNKNKKTQNRFWLYIKLCSVMGVAWTLEIIQYNIPDDAMNVWVFVLMSAYNTFIGVIIFIVFVFKTKILLMLCKRFNIRNRWTHRAFNVNSSTKSEVSKASKSHGRTKSTTDSDFGEGTSFKNTEEDTKQSNTLKLDVLTPVY